ncbi:hypothetical protein DL546_006960 [Coniochaeta pulveracea]|uniref:Uncharacterized protein n=1 Tax=Coniochaeta pulveracea TaxID=177199 RepID=A0A420Y849_9PEZI|nr:hypothetical protein DL546_006960 [Coniochaeta pulveracea]
MDDQGRFHGTNPGLPAHCSRQGGQRALCARPLTHLNEMGLVHEHDATLEYADEPDSLLEIVARDVTDNFPMPYRSSNTKRWAAWPPHLATRTCSLATKPKRNNTADHFI